MKKTEDPLVQKMGLEVFELFLPEEQCSSSLPAFNNAFKKTVAPKNKIFYSQNKGSYGYFLYAVQAEVKRLIKNKGSTKKIRIPNLCPDKWRVGHVSIARCAQ